MKLYLCALTANRPRAVDRYIDYFGGASRRGLTALSPSAVSHHRFYAAVSARPFVERAVPRRAPGPTRIVGARRNSVAGTTRTIEPFASKMVTGAMGSSFLGSLTSGKTDRRSIINLLVAGCC